MPHPHAFLLCPGFSIVAFGNSITLQTAVGSAIAIFGAGLYSYRAWAHLPPPPTAVGRSHTLPTPPSVKARMVKH